MPRPVPVFLLAIVIPLLLGACAAPQPTAVPLAPGAPWVSELGRGHPLTGRIWDTREGRFVAPEEVVAALAQARFVLLGERHDNPDHHRIQAWLLAEMIARGRRPAVAFEMFTSAQQARLDAYLAAHPRDAAGIGGAVAWAKTGWPEWRLYQPIAQAALDGGAPILAANLTRQTVMDISWKGADSALGAVRAEALGLDRPLPPQVQALMRNEIVESHCNQLPEAMIDPMVDVQRARDAVMADALLRGANMEGRDGAVLITGGGHARGDHGVPFHLRRRAPEGAVITTVGIAQVSHSDPEPADYAGRYGVEALPFDFVWFTPRIDETDPCDKFADQLRRAKERHEQKKKAE
jgi:uncharacterized iron-regulated protein